MNAELDAWRAEILSSMIAGFEALQAELRKSRGRVAESLDRSVEAKLAVERLGGGLEELRSEIGEISGTIVSAQDECRVAREALASISINLNRVEHRVRSVRHETVSEFDALLQLREQVPLEGARPLVWGWALSPSGLLELVNSVQAKGPRTIVECGSGLSTIYLGQMLRSVEGARVVALEHDKDFEGETRQLLARRGLLDAVDLRHAPLQEITLGNFTHNWYSLDSVQDLREIDLLLVDGPPKSSGDEARYPALPVLHSRLSSNAVVILDDVGRREERQVAERWEAEYPSLRRMRSIGPDQAIFLWEPTDPVTEGAEATEDGD